MPIDEFNDSIFDNYDNQHQLWNFSTDQHLQAVPRIEFLIKIINLKM